jgi:hypothetical protein
MSNQYVQASHHLTELEAELRAAEVSRLLALERARDAHRQPQYPPPQAQPPRPKIRVITHPQPK